MSEATCNVGVRELFSKNKWCRFGQYFGVLAGIDYVNEPQSQLELNAIRRGVERGCPQRDESLPAKTVARMGLENIRHSRGRLKLSDKGF